MLGDTEIAWQQMGEGPDLVLVHGLATNRAFWYLNVASGLRDRYRITLFDLPGHGYSGVPNRGYSAAALGQTLNTLLDTIGIAQTALVGHSYGGAAALEAVCQNPQRYSRLALLDTRISRLQPQMRLHDVEHLTPFERETAARSTAAFGYDWESETEVGLRFLEAAARLRVDGDTAEARDEFTPFGEGRGAQRAAKQWLRLLETTQAAAEFREQGAVAETIAALSLPVLLMYAQGSRGERSGRALKELLPHAHYVGVPDAGHFFPVSKPQLVIAALSDFLARTEAVRRTVTKPD